MKLCGNKKCEQQNPQTLNNFYKNVSSKDKLSSYCKQCTNRKAKEYYPFYKERMKDFNKHLKFKADKIKKRLSQSELTNRSTIKRNLRTPKWVNLLEIDLIYRNRPENHHVDHIIPLIGKNVSGLHVPWNLQYLSQTENIKKNNKFDGTLNNDGWKNEK